jgi:hypothetical protein
MSLAFSYGVSPVSIMYKQQPRDHTSDSMLRWILPERISGEAYCKVPRKRLSELEFKKLAEPKSIILTLKYLSMRIFYTYLNLVLSCYRIYVNINFCFYLILNVSMNNV